MMTMAAATQHPEDIPLAPSVADAPAVAPATSNGAAAQVMMDAEVALAHQNSATAQLDLQVLAAILNAHLSTAEGRDALDKLQEDTEAAVRTRADLDTPAGARDFQRFLVGKLRDIRSVIANTSLDDTSKSALMTAWTSLYNVSKDGLNTAVDRQPITAAPGATSPKSASPDSAAAPGSGAAMLGTDMDPYLDSLLADDPGPLAAEGLPPQSAAPPMPVMPMLPSIPNLGGGLMPGAGSMPSWGAPSGAPFSGLLSGAGGDRSFDPDSRDRPAPAESDKPQDPEAPESSPAMLDTPPAGATTVTLPNGDTVTAANPQLASAIKAAASGVAIPDAFRQQGMTIPAPGTPVAKPIDPADVSVGDIGIFTDRHALALGHSRALLNGQIQHISTVKGPNFLGWEHPPSPAVLSEQAKTQAPTPTRPAAQATGHQGGLPTQPSAY